MDQDQINIFIKDLHQFKLPLKPQSQERARMGKYGMYIPEKSRKFKKAVQDLVRLEYNQAPIEGPVMIDVTFYFKQAKSNKDMFCMNKVDLDNLLKLLFDSLNKLVFKDDKQIVHIISSKAWSDEDHILLNVFELKE